MKIIFHGKFAADYGKEHTILAASIAEAVDALSRQLRFYDDVMLDKRPVACIVGHETIESLAECPDEIHIVPAINGGKGIGKILVGAALIGLALTGVGGIAAIGIYGATTVGTLALGIGISLVLAGISELFIKSPSLSKDSDPDASKYLGISTNTTKLGTLRSYSMGRIKMTSPHLLALNVDSNDLVRGEFPA
jgi:predicted phage tail protein